MVSQLLALALDPNARSGCDRSGYAPLHLAAMQGDVLMVAELIKAGAKVDRWTAHGTPLTCAALVRRGGRKGEVGVGGGILGGGIKGGRELGRGCHYRGGGGLGGWRRSGGLGGWRGIRGVEGAKDMGLLRRLAWSLRCAALVRREGYGGKLGDWGLWGTAEFEGSQGDRGCGYLGPRPLACAPAHCCAKQKEGAPPSGICGAVYKGNCSYLVVSKP